MVGETRLVPITRPRRRLWKPSSSALLLVLPISTMKPALSSLTENGLRAREMIVLSS
jgi:hypothetical protein